MIYVRPPIVVSYIGLWVFLQVYVYASTISWLDQMSVQSTALHMRTASTGCTVLQELFVKHARI